MGLIQLLLKQGLYLVHVYIECLFLESSATPLLRHSPVVAAARLARRFTHASVQPNLPQGLLFSLIFFCSEN